MGFEQYRAMFLARISRLGKWSIMGGVRSHERATMSTRNVYLGGLLILHFRSDLRMYNTMTTLDDMNNF
jgi:hypothetical protein